MLIKALCEGGKWGGWGGFEVCMNERDPYTCKSHKNSEDEMRKYFLRALFVKCVVITFNEKI